MARGDVSPFDRTQSGEIVGVFASPFWVFKFGDNVVFCDGVFYEEIEVEWFVAGMADVFA